MLRASDETGHCNHFARVRACMCSARQGLPSSERIHAVIRFDILVRSRSFSRSSPFGVLLLAALALAPAAGCSVYEDVLLEGRAAGGAGGSAEEAGSAGSAGSVAGGTAVDPLLIDDFEDGDEAVRFVATPRRDGQWDVNNDGTATGMQTPEPLSFVPTLLGEDAPYAGDRYAGYMKGSGFTTYGAYMNVSMRVWTVYADTPQYDASAHRGITFWAKVGSGATTTKAMRVRFISGDSDPRGKKCKDPAAMPAPAQDELCYNHYYSPLTLSATWTKYTLPFADFVQGGAGAVNDSIALSAMYGLEFYFLQNSEFEFWIDDLSFAD